MQNKDLGRYMYFAVAIIALGGLTLMFSGVLDRQYNPNADPVTRTSGERSEVVLKQNRWGHYVTGGAINGEDVVFMVDTGATDVAIPDGLARRLGLEFGREIRINTANGVSRGWDTRLASVRIGGIELYDVAATIAPGLGGEDEALLGMSFLRRVEMLQSGDTLTLRYPPVSG